MRLDSINPVASFGLGILVVLLLAGAFLLGRRSADNVTTMAFALPGIATATPTATSSPTSTPSSTATPSPTSTPSPTATPVPGLSFEDAAAAVYARHSTLFGLMGGYQLTMGPANSNARDSVGNVTVQVEWVYQNKPRDAYYLVDPKGQVTPLDANAKRFDAVAKFGPLALKALFSGL